MSDNPSVPSANGPDSQQNQTNPSAQSHLQGIEKPEEAVGFDRDLIKKYPRSNKKLQLNVQQFGLTLQPEEKERNGQSVHISPHGIEFRTSEEFEKGSLLKIMVTIPDYWSRKQKFVDYGRVDTPREFRVLGKVLQTEDVGKRGRKKLVTVQTLIMDDVDEQVLKTFLQEG